MFVTFRSAGIAGKTGARNERQKERYCNSDGHRL